MRLSWVWPETRPPALTACPCSSMSNSGMLLVLILSLYLILVSMRVFSLPLNVVVSSLCRLRRVIGSTLATGVRSPFLMLITSWLLGFLLGVSLRSYILLLLMTRRVGSRGGTLVRTLLFCGMLSIMLLSLDNPLPSFPLIRKRPSIEWIGDSCVRLCYLWASANLLLNGWTCFILTFPVLCLLMVICRLSSHCHGGCAKAVLCPRSCMCLSLRC